VFACAELAVSLANWSTATPAVVCLVPSGKVIPLAVPVIITLPEYNVPPIPTPPCTTKAPVEFEVAAIEFET